MTSKTLLGHFPKLALWYKEEGRFQANKLTDLCEALSQSHIEEITHSLGLHLQKLTESNAKENINDMEDDCLVYDCEFSQILLLASEWGLRENKLGALKEAIYTLAQITQSSVYLFIAAWLALNCDDFHKCIQICDAAPHKNSDFYGLKGQACLESKQFALARQCFLMSTKLAPKDPLQWFWLAKTCFGLGDDYAWDAALQCAQLAPKDPEVGILLSMIALEEPIRSERMTGAWNTLWNQIELHSTNGFVLGILMDMALSLKDPYKVDLLVDRINPSQVDQVSELTGKLPSFLKKLQYEEFTAVKPAVIDFLASITKQDSHKQA